jgi:hypothetical protein
MRGRFRRTFTAIFPRAPRFIERCHRPNIINKGRFRFLERKRRGSLIPIIFYLFFKFFIALDYWWYITLVMLESMVSVDSAGAWIPLSLVRRVLVTPSYDH